MSNPLGSRAASATPHLSSDLDRLLLASPKADEHWSKSLILFLASNQTVTRLCYPTVLSSRRPAASLSNKIMAYSRRERLLLYGTVGVVVNDLEQAGQQDHGVLRPQRQAAEEKSERGYLMPCFVRKQQEAMAVRCQAVYIHTTWC